MQVKSLGYRTDLIFPAFDGEIIDRGDYLVVKTPSNPTFYWGNFLLFENPPQTGDHVRWPKLFGQEIGQPPHISHETYGWDTTQNELGVIQPFLESGYLVENSVVLTANRKTLASKSSPEFTFRRLETEDDWMQSIENQVLCRESVFSEDSYRVFWREQATRYRAMVSQGIGSWFGAFSGTQLVGNLGIFSSDKLARYQSVCTHPNFRRQGVAGTLIYEAALFAMKQYQAETLVIVAKANSSAERLYRSNGFQVAEHQVGLMKADEYN
ncbi:MAG: GNAT family N-acetyltransferase [Anaerolineales bacterium]